MFMCGHELQKEPGAAQIIHNVVRGAGIPYWVLFLEDSALKLEHASVMCISDKFPGDADADGLGTPHGELLPWGLWPIPSVH